MPFSMSTPMLLSAFMMVVVARSPDVELVVEDVPASATAAAREVVDIFVSFSSATTRLVRLWSVVDIVFVCVASAVVCVARLLSELSV
jgi:hypothetical protein